MALNVTHYRRVRQCLDTKRRTFRVSLKREVCGRAIQADGRTGPVSLDGDPLRSEPADSVSLIRLYFR